MQSIFRACRRGNALIYIDETQRKAIMYRKGTPRRRYQWAKKRYK